MITDTLKKVVVMVLQTLRHGTRSQEPETLRTRPETSSYLLGHLPNVLLQGFSSFSHIETRKGEFDLGGFIRAA